VVKLKSVIKSADESFPYGLKKKEVISFSNFFFHSFFFLNLTHARLEYNSDTCLNQTSLRPAFVFRIDRCYVYAGWSNKNFQFWDFILTKKTNKQTKLDICLM
jgi:hypothetical protein